MAGFNARPFHVWFVVEKVVLGQVSVRVLWFFPVIIIPLVLHTHLHLHVCSYQKHKWAKFGHLPKISALSEIGLVWTEKYICWVVRRLPNVVVAVNKCFVPVKHSPTNLCVGDTAFSVRYRVNFCTLFRWILGAKKTDKPHLLRVGTSRPLSVASRY